MAKKGEPAVITEIETVEASDDRINQIIWKQAGLKSVREISELTGLKPEEVLRRKNELLEEVDILSIQQKRQRLLVELDGMARDARERAAGTIDEYFAGMLNSSVAAIKTMMTEMARMEKQDTGRIEALNSLRVKELLRLVDETVARSVREIAAAHDLDESELMEVFQGHLNDAAREIDSA